MPLFSNGLVRMESGALYSSTMQPLQCVTNVRQGYTIPRANVNVIGRGKPLERRPVINYTPIDFSFDYYHKDSAMWQCLGLLNTTGICAAITETKAATATWGIRSTQVLFAPTDSARYNGLLDLKSGVLTSYTLQGSVGEPARGNFSLGFLDMSGSVNTTLRDTTNYSANLVKPAGMSLTGIQFTGYGITGVNIQSFAFSVGFGRTAVMELGSKFPTERPLTEVGATLQIQGWFDGINNSVTGLQQYDCGDPTFGTAVLTLTPGCGGSPTRVTMKNPYLDGVSIEGQAGGFSTVAFSLSLPIGPNPLETGDGSVVVLS
jgi:hypothetical protein